MVERPHDTCGHLAGKSERIRRTHRNSEIHADGTLLSHLRVCLQASGKSIANGIRGQHGQDIQSAGAGRLVRF